MNLPVVELELAVAFPSVIAPIVPIVVVEDVTPFPVVLANTGILLTVEVAGPCTTLDAKIFEFFMIFPRC